MSVNGNVLEDVFNISVFISYLQIVHFPQKHYGDFLLLLDYYN